MRTLYVKIIITTMTIMILSALFSFAASNLYYQLSLKASNDEKITQIANRIVEVYEKGDSSSVTGYLDAQSDLGYKFLIVSPDGQEHEIGEPFRIREIEQKHINAILNGQTYHGIRDYSWKPFVTGFFEDDLRNSVGVPIQVNGENHALFVRPNSQVQFGEMRIFLGMMLILMLVFSFLLVLFSSRLIVRPINKLTAATRRLATGNYHVKLDVNRRDEIGRLAKDFSKMSSSLEKTEQKRQEFVSNVSHEIQSPLTSIQGFSQALREDNLTEEERNHYLNIIESESKRLSTLSQQLLTLSFLDHELDSSESISFNVAEQIKEAVTATEWQWRNKEIAIEMDLSPAITIGNPKLIQQVWVNLISNAIRYSQPAAAISIQVLSYKRYIEVQVKDSGIGISEDDLPQIFERFYKADKARTRTDNSTGLGLSIVKKVIDIHHGTIEVTSELDKGTTFIVTLPQL